MDDEWVEAISFMNRLETLIPMVYELRSSEATTRFLKGE